MNSENDIIRWIDFPMLGKPDIGYISVVENNGRIPFPVERVYWTYHTPHHVTRGRHAHRTLKQVLVGVSGIVTVHTEDLRGRRQTFRLDQPGRGLYMPPLCWHEMEFSHGGVLLSLASQAFDESDYIRDYPSFKSLKPG